MDLGLERVWLGCRDSVGVGVAESWSGARDRVEIRVEVRLGLRGVGVGNKIGRVGVRAEEGCGFGWGELGLGLEFGIRVGKSWG